MHSSALSSDHSTFSALHVPKCSYKSSSVTSPHNEGLNHGTAMKYKTKRCYAVWEQIQRQHSYISSIVQAKIFIPYIVYSQMPSGPVLTNNISDIPRDTSAVFSVCIASDANQPPGSLLWLTEPAASHKPSLKRPESAS